MINNFKLNFASVLLMSSTMFSSASFADNLKFPDRDKLVVHEAGTDKCNISISNENFLYAPPADVKFQAAFAGIAVSALITAGVDFIGNQISERAMRRERTISASENIIPKDNSDIKPKCLIFTHGEGDIEIIIGLEGVKNAKDEKLTNPVLIQPTLRQIKYSKTVDGKSKKERGIMVQVAYNSAGSGSSVSQTLVVGDLKTGNTYENTAQPLEFPIMPNPYHFLDKKEEKSLMPFTITVTMTEVKESSELLSFISGVANAANDDVTGALISAAN